MQILALFSASVASYFFLFIERQKNSEYWVQFSWGFCSIATIAIAKKVILLGAKLFYACFVSSSRPVSIVLMLVVREIFEYLWMHFLGDHEAWILGFLRKVNVFAVIQVWKQHDSEVTGCHYLSAPPKYEIDNDGYSLIIFAYRNPRDLPVTVCGSRRNLVVVQFPFWVHGLSLPLFDCVAAIRFSSWYSSSFHFQSAILQSWADFIFTSSMSMCRLWEKKTVQHHVLFDSFRLATRSGSEYAFFSVYEKQVRVSIIIISINLFVVYQESVNLIGYITRRLSADSLQLWIANENRSPIYFD